LTEKGDIVAKVDKHVALTVGNGVKRNIQRKSVPGIRAQAIAIGAIAEGAGLAAAATLADTTITRLNNLARDNPVFAEMLQEAQAIAASVLEAAAYKRALHGTPQAIYQRGEHVGDKIVYSDSLAMFLLKALDSKRFNVRSIEVSGPGGGAIAIAVKHYDAAGLVVSEQ
jgi:hypothetical protein